MRLDVETDQVGAEQAIYKLTLPGTNAECLRIWPGDMPEDSDASVGPLLFDHSGNQREVIVLHQHHRPGCAFHFLQQGIGKFPVYRLIVAPVVGTKNRPRVSDVAKRPEAFVGKAVVISLLFFLSEPDSPKGIARIFRRYSQAVILINGFQVGITVPVRDPGTITCAEYRLKSCDETAWGNSNLPRPAFAYMPVGLAVGENEKPSVLQACSNVNGKSICGPLGLSLFAQPGFCLGSRASRGKTLRKSRNFPGQGTKQIQIRHLDARRGSASRAQSSHPVGCPRDGAFNAPAHDQQGDKSDENNVCQRTQESLAPNAQTLGTDIASIVNNGECPQNLVLAMQGHGGNVNRGGAKFLEDVGISIVLQCLRNNCRRCTHERSQRSRHRNDATFRAINGEAGQIFAGRALQRPMQGLQSVFLEIPFDVSGEAVPNHRIAFLQVATEATLLHQHLVVEGAKGNQRDADNEGDNEPGTQQSHAKILESTQRSGRLKTYSVPRIRRRVDCTDCCPRPQTSPEVCKNWRSFPHTNRNSPASVRFLESPWMLPC